jgi:hypothetical protein
MDARKPYAHLTEGLLDEPAGWCSGRFDGWIETGRPRGGGPIEDVDLQTALDWAAARVSIILVSIGGEDHFSAGAEQTEPDPYPSCRPRPSRFGLGRGARRGMAPSNAGHGPSASA